MDNQDLISLDQVGLGTPDITTPIASPEVLDFANSQLIGGMNPDVAMQSTMDKYGEGQPFDFTYNPTSQRFQDNATDSPQGTTSNGLVSLDQVDFSQPAPRQKGTNYPITTPDDSFFQLDNFTPGLKNVGQDIKNAALDVGQYFSNFGAEHETFQPAAATAKEQAAAKFLGVPISAEQSSIPGLDFLTNPSGLGRGSVYKLSSAEQQKLSNAYSAAYGGTPTQEQARIAATYAGDTSSYDPVSVMLGDDPFTKLLAFPRMANTQKYYLIQDTVHAMDVSQNPSQYSKQEVQQAQQFLAYWKDQKNNSAWKGLQDTWQKFKENPEAGTLGLVAGIAQNPLLLASPEAKLGDAVLGGAAEKAAQAAKNAETLSKLGVEAAPGASDAASTMAAQSQRSAAQFADEAQRAQATQRALARSSAALNVAGASAAGAAINAGTSEAQEQVNQGFVHPKDLISPAAIGAIMGGGFSAVGHFLGGKGASTEAEPETAPEAPQGSEAPTPRQTAPAPEAAPAAESVEPTGENEPSILNTIRNIDMFGNAKKLIPLGALSASLYGYGQLTGNQEAQKGAMFLPFAALGLRGEGGERVWRIEDINNYKMARAMDAHGEDPRNIYNVTGFFKNADGNFTKELDDSQYQIKPGVLSDKQPHTLDEVMFHPELKAQLPKLLQNVKVQEVDGNGSYDYATKTINVPSQEYLRNIKAINNVGQPLTQREVLIHETQHAIQHAFGMARGGSPKEFIAPLAQAVGKLRQERGQLLQSKEEWGPDIDPRYAQTIENRLTEINNLLKGVDTRSIYKEAKRRYMGLQGENQAYATENRLDLSKEDRKYSYPEWDMPTSLEGQIPKYHSPDYTLAEHLSRTGEMDEDGKLRGMVLGEDKLPQEENVVSQAKEGNQQAISSLYKQYMPRLTRTLNTMLRGKTGSTLGLEGEDIAHIAFTKAIQGLPSFRGDSSFYTYLYSTAKNAALDALRRAKGSPALERIEKGGEEAPSTSPLTGKDEELTQRSDHPMGPPKTVENIPDTGGTPEEHMVAQQASQMFNHVLQNMPEDIRNTVKLVDLIGMSHDEAAKALGVPVGTIKSRLHNAESTIRDSIASGKGAQFRKQGGFATPEALKKIVKSAALIGAGAYLGNKYDGTKGAIYGGLAALLLGDMSPRGIYRGVKTALSPDERLNVNYLLNDWDARRASMDLVISRVQYALDKLIPSKESQKKVTYWLDGDKTISLNPKERQAATIAKAFYDKVLQEGLETRVLKDFLTNYVNHEWVNPKMAQKFQEEIENSFPTNMSPKDRHALARQFLTLQKGKDAGLIPKTENISDLIAIYGRSMARAMANKALLAGLKDHTIGVKNGIKAVMSATKAPYNFVSINHPQLVGLRVSPDIAPSLKYLFYQNGGGVISALEGLNIALKREQTGLSLFHPYALTMAFLTANPFGKLASNVGELGKSFVGKSSAHEALLNDGTSMEQFIQGGLRNGLKLTLRKGQVSDEDINTGFYKGLSQLQGFLDKNFPAGGKVGEGIKKLYGLSDKLVWENVHTGLKGVTFMNAYERLLRNNQSALDAGKIGAMPTKDELYRQAASFTNDIFGGLNWRRLADDATTRIGRLAALTVSTPLARRIGQIMLFAPDWTYSTIRSFVKATDQGSGLGGLLKPKTLADLHRQYLVRNAVFYFTLYNALNVAMSGHNIWQNKDPLTVDMGHGERLYINKHFMEVPHAIMNPGKFVLGKLGTIPSEALDQALKVDYLSPDYMPPMKNRFEHLMQRVEPFGLSTLQKEGPKAALLSVMGAPVYGGHRAPDEDELAAKREAKSAAAKKAAATREQRRMEKLMRGEM